MATHQNKNDIDRASDERSDDRGPPILMPGQGISNSAMAARASRARAARGGVLTVGNGEESKEETPAPELGDYMDAIGSAYSDLYDVQIEAIRKTEEVAAIKDSESQGFAGTLLALAAEVAVIGAIGAVGEQVKLIISGFSHPFLQEPTVAAAAMKDIAKSLARKSVHSAFDLGRSLPPAPRFFGAQREALMEVAAKQKKNYFLTIQPTLRASKNPVASAEALLAGVEGATSVAAGIQQVETLREWTIALSRRSQGVTKDGGADVKNLRHAAAAAGVLDLRISLDGSGLVGIESARLGGLNAALRRLIASQPVSDLGIPIRVTVVPEKSYGVRLTAAMNEKGQAWLGDANEQGRRRLNGLAGWPNRLGFEEEGIRVLMQERVGARIIGTVTDPNNSAQTMGAGKEIKA